MGIGLHYAIHRMMPYARKAAAQAMTARRLRDRGEAGRLLAGRLAVYAHRPDVIVLALTRGGVVVASELARALDVPLDMFLVRKLGVPGHKEFAVGGIATGGVRMIHQDVARGFRIPPDLIVVIEQKEQRELERRERLCRGNRPRPDLRNRTVILVDDGLATIDTILTSASAGLPFDFAHPSTGLGATLSVVEGSGHPEQRRGVKAGEYQPT